MSNTRITPTTLCKSAVTNPPRNVRLPGMFGMKHVREAEKESFPTETETQVCAGAVRPVTLKCKPVHAERWTSQAGRSNTCVTPTTL